MNACKLNVYNYKLLIDKKCVFSFLLNTFSERLWSPRVAEVIKFHVVVRRRQTIVDHMSTINTLCVT